MRLTIFKIIPFLLVGPAVVVHPGCRSDATPAAPSEPGWPTTDWPVSTPAAEGIDPAAIDALHRDTEEGVYGLVDHFLLIRHGRIVVDHHYEQDYSTIAAQYVA